MKAFKQLILLIGLPLLLASCAGSKGFVTFEVLQPADITYPENVSKVAYLNRAPYSRENFQEGNYDHMDRVTLKILDTLVNNNLYTGIHDAAKNSEKLYYLDSMLRIDFRRRDTLNMEEPMTEYFREDLYSNYDLDALVVLEYYKLGVSLSPPFWDFMHGEFVKEYRFIGDFLWRIYARGQEKPIDEFRLQDTLFFTNYSSMPPDEYMNGTSVVRQSCYELGYRYGFRLNPFWMEVSRVMFRGGNAEFRRAAELADKDMWDQSKAIWEQQLASKDRKSRAMALNNLAIYYELRDDLEQAQKYIDLAVQDWENTYIIQYKKQLDKRMEKIRTIEKQLRIE